MTFTEGSGFARWADTNRLVILFPQVEARILNTKACWDWWGYTGKDFPASAKSGRESHI